MKDFREERKSALPSKAVILSQMDKNQHHFYFLLQLMFKREYLQASNNPGLPCWLLHHLKKSSELITTSSPSTSYTTPWVCTQTT